MGSDSYDPDSINERPKPYNPAPLISISDGIVLQLPLSRLGLGPGLVIFLPSPDSIEISERSRKPLDPEPIQKWAEEGFAVIGVIGSQSVPEAITKSAAVLQDAVEVDIKDKFGIIVYDSSVLSPVATAIVGDSRFPCIVSYGDNLPSCATPILSHLPERAAQTPRKPETTTHIYPCPSAVFVLPQSSGYHPPSAAIAHTRSLVFLRKYIGGPVFDIEAIWGEHTRYEFVVRSVAKTMGTMVAEPYVNHIPTMTGGIGREKLLAFYRDHFIFANPADTTLDSISRTVGPDRVVDEFIFKCTHDKTIDWLLPGVPPSNKKLAIPMLGVVNFRGDRLYHEHIWWDQATALVQVGVLPSHLPYSHPDGNKVLRLPVAGAESARLLADETDGTSNEMLGADWGVSDGAKTN